MGKTQEETILDLVVQSRSYSACCTLKRRGAARNVVCLLVPALPRAPRLRRGEKNCGLCRRDRDRPRLSLSSFSSAAPLHEEEQLLAMSYYDQSLPPLSHQHQHYPPPLPPSLPQRHQLAEDSPSTPAGANHGATGAGNSQVRPLRAMLARGAAYVPPPPSLPLPPSLLSFGPVPVLHLSASLRPPLTLLRSVQLRYLQGKVRRRSLPLSLLLVLILPAVTLYRKVRFLFFPLRRRCNHRTTSQSSLRGRCQALLPLSPLPMTVMADSNGLVVHVRAQWSTQGRPSARATSADILLKWGLEAVLTPSLSSPPLPSHISNSAHPPIIDCRSSATLFARTAPPA